MPERVSDSDFHQVRSNTTDIFSSILLPCGRSVRNRLVKVATYEHLGNKPNVYHNALYSEWAEGDWGMIITGNVQVSPMHLSLGYDMVVPRSLTSDSLKAFMGLADAIHSNDALNSAISSFPSDPPSPTLAIMQLSHAGRQSPNFLGGRFPFVPPLSASRIRLGSSHGATGKQNKNVKQSVISRLFYRLLFQTPRQMSHLDIEMTIQEFVSGASLAFKSGFDGIQLHAAHGYLLAQYISPECNVRQDEYSCTPEHALHFLHRIIISTREALPKQFIVGLKFNAADYVNTTTDNGRNDEERILNHIRTISSWGLVDFIEVSGGDYENPEFMSTKPIETDRQVLFARFSHQVLKTIRSLPVTPAAPLVLLTGGLRTPAHLYSVLECQHAQLLGIARGAILCPQLPRVLRSNWMSENSDWWRQPFVREPHIYPANSIIKRCVYTLTSSVKLVGAGMTMAWYIVTMKGLTLSRIRKESQSSITTIKKPRSTRIDYKMDGVDAVFWMWFWVDRGSNFWLYFGITPAVLLALYCLSQLPSL